MKILPTPKNIKCRTNPNTLIKERLKTIHLDFICFQIHCDSHRK